MFVILLVKGFIIGFSFTIPGCSGGTFAVYLGVFDKMVEAIGNLFRDFRKNFTYLFPLGLGLVLGIVLFAKLMALALQTDSFITILFFIGMTLGGVPSLWRTNVGGRKVGRSGVLAAFGAVALILAMALFQVLSGTTGVGYFDMAAPATYPLLVALGVVSAMTMIVPGVSGSALLLILGYYTAIVSNVAGNLTDFNALGYNLLVMVPFAVGAVVGVVLMSKGIAWLLHRHPVQTYLAIVGFVVASAAFLLLWIRDPGSADAFVDQIPVYRDVVGYIVSRPWDLPFGILSLAAGIFGSLAIVRLGRRTVHGGTATD